MSRSSLELIEKAVDDDTNNCDRARQAGVSAAVLHCDLSDPSDQLLNDLMAIARGTNKPNGDEDDDSF